MSGQGPHPNSVSSSTRARTSRDATVARHSGLGWDPHIFRFSTEHARARIARALFLSAKFTFHYQALAVCEPPGRTAGGPPARDSGKMDDLRS